MSLICADQRMIFVIGIPLFLICSDNFVQHISVNLIFPGLISKKTVFACLEFFRVEIECHSKKHSKDISFDKHQLLVACFNRLSLVFSSDKVSDYSFSTPKVSSISSAAICLLCTRIILSSTFAFPKRFIFPYQTSSWSMIAKCSQNSSTVFM